MLSIRSRICSPKRCEAVFCNAGKAALSSRRLMCSALSCTSHGPLVSLPWHVAPQPVLEASNIITRSAVGAGMGGPL